MDPNVADRVSSPYSGTVASLAANKLSVRAGKTKSRLSAVPTRRSISFTIPESVTITRNGLHQFDDLKIIIDHEDFDRVFWHER